MYFLYVMKYNFSFALSRLSYDVSTHNVNLGQKVGYHEKRGQDD